MGDWTARFRGMMGEPLITKRVTKYWHDQKPYTGTDKFVDDFFPPTSDSILSTRCVWDHAHKQELECMGEWTFMRSEEFLGEDFCVFDDQVSHKDISQGALGDCYFLSALAAMAEFPGLVNQNFRLGGAKSQNGYYEILLFIDEEWQIVIVDDYFPVLKGQNYPTFCRPTRNVIWMLLMEKAWAKINDGFSNIIAGKSCWPFHLLTGFPCSMHYFQSNKNTFWDTIKFYDERNDIMTCSSMRNENGICGEHMYTLRFAGEVEDKDGNKVRLLCLRNPWAQGEWTGDWSDNSDKWTPELRKLLGVENQDDGIFYMQYEDFIEYYSAIDVAHTPHFNKNTSMFSHNDAQPKVYNLVCETQSTLSINISSKNESEPFKGSVFVCSYNNGDISNIEGSYVTTSCEYGGRIYNMKPGKYCVAIYPHSTNAYNVRFSNNGRHIIKQAFENDGNFALLGVIKPNICKMYYQKIQNSDVEQFINNVNCGGFSYEVFCDDNVSTWVDLKCSEFKDVSNQQRANNMICNFLSEEIPQVVQNHNEVSNKIVAQSNKLISRGQDVNYRYLSVTLPNKKIEKINISVSMRDQGWSTSECSGSWMDIVVEDTNGNLINDPQRIFENLCVPQFKEYNLEINESHPLWNLMQEGNKLHLIARSAWGWEIWVQKAKIVLE